MKKQIAVLVLFFGILCLMVPAVRLPAAEWEDNAVQEKSSADSFQTVRIYYIDTEDAENILADTWISPEYQMYCFEIGQKYNLSPYLLMAMIEKESSGNAQAANSTGDSGLMQVNPKWHEDRMERLGVSDLTDPYSNILVAADYLSELLQENNYNIPLGLMKYNMDHEQAETLMEQGIYSEYAKKVVERMWELKLLHQKEDAE